MLSARYLPMASRLLLALGSAALHVLLERLALGDVGLLGLGVVGIEGGRLRVAGVRLGICYFIENVK
jgi:hypothetical protein